MQISGIELLNKMREDTKKFEDYFETSFLIQGLVLSFFGMLATLHLTQGYLFVQCNDRHMCRISGQHSIHNALQKCAYSKKKAWRFEHQKRLNVITWAVFDVQRSRAFLLL